MTVGEWGAMWADLYPGRANEDTQAHTAVMLEPFVRAHRDRPLEAIDVLLAQAWAVRHPGHVRYLRQMFQKAQKAGLVSLNVWAHVEVATGKSSRVPPTPAELERLVGAARARGGWWLHFADCMIFTAYSGLRLAEVAGVQAQDVLEAGGRLVVHGKRRAGEVAPRARVVAVFGPGREALARQVPDVGRVWRSKSGRPLSKRVVSEYMIELREEVGAEHLTFHGLRHHCASWLLDNGASKQDVAVQLGHVDDVGRVDTTQVERVYGHVSVEPALKRLEAKVYLGGSDGDAAAG